MVGVDGSPPSIRALVWAVRLARRRGWTLEVVTAWPDADSILVHDVPGHFSAPRQRAFAAQDAALAEARATGAGGTSVLSTIVNAHPVEALASRAASARLVVTGAHGAGPDPGRHHDRAAVGESVATLVRCPVVVVHDAGRTSTPARPREGQRPPTPARQTLHTTIRESSATPLRTHTLRRP